MSWKNYELGDLIEEFSLRAKDYDGEIKYLNFLGVSNKDGITKSKYAAEDKASSYKIIEKGCFAYNPYRVNVGSIGLVNEDITGLISPAYVVFKTKPISIIPELLLKFLKSEEGLRQIKLYARGTVRQALRFKDLAKIEISLPSYEDQKDLFKRFNNTELKSKLLIIEFERQLSIIQKLRQALLKEAMQGFLIPQNPNYLSAKKLLENIKIEKERLVKEKKIRKFKPLPKIESEEIPFEIPLNWEWCRLGEVANHIFDGPFGSHLKTADYTNTGVRVIRLENLGYMEFKHEKLTFISESKYESIKKHTVYEGDLIIGSFLADGVKCVALPKLKHTAVAKADCFTVRVNPKLFSSKFLMYLLTSDLMFPKLSSLLRGMTRLRINTTQLKNLPIPLPPFNEQLKIVRKLDSLLENCDGVEKSILESINQTGDFLNQFLAESLGLTVQTGNKKMDSFEKEDDRQSKFGSKIILMDLVNLLKEQGELHAENLWKMSKFHKDIDAFYEELKKQIEVQKTIKESPEKGYLELA